jgi:hypothetical protein
MAKKLRRIGKPSQKVANTPAIETPATPTKPARRGASKGKLSHLKGLFKKAQTGIDEGFSVSIPDGQYNCELKQVKLTESKKGNDMVQWDLSILDGDHEGQLLLKFNMLVTEQNLQWLLKDLTVFNYDPASVDDESLPEILAEITASKSVVSAAVVSKDEYRNVYINSVVGTMDDDETSETESSSTSEESGDWDDEETEEDWDEVELNCPPVGSIVQVTKGTKTIQGVTEKIDEDKGLFWLKVEGRSKLIKIDTNDESIECALIDDNEEDDVF